MNTTVTDFVKFILHNKELNTKPSVIDAACKEFPLVKDGRALYHTDSFAVVFCYSKNKTFSNVILSLSKLEKYDRIPCFVVIVRRELPNEILMINSTFINKISHSSQELTTTNIRGSFLGSNIRKNVSELSCTNSPEHFNELFAYHKGFTWQENLERLVECTNNIHPTTQKATLDENELKILFDSPARAAGFIASEDYDTLLRTLLQRCEEIKDALLVASRIDNVNIRGRIIEALIASGGDERTRLLQNLADAETLLPTYFSGNDLGDFSMSFDNSDTFTDIKTKIIYLDSNPKAYNIDKFLKCMATQRTVFMFFFVGIDTTGISNTILCSVYHKELLETTILQHHWAGRATRGVAQFNGRTINKMLTTKNFHNEINNEQCVSFLQNLLSR